MANRQHAHAMDYLLKTSPPAEKINPHAYTVVYTNRYGSPVSLNHRRKEAAELDCERLRGMGYEPIINDTSVMDQPMLVEEMANA